MPLAIHDLNRPESVEAVLRELDALPSFRTPGLLATVSLQITPDDFEAHRIVYLNEVPDRLLAHSDGKGNKVVNRLLASDRLQEIAAVGQDVLRAATLPILVYHRPTFGSSVLGILDAQNRISGVVRYTEESWSGVVEIRTHYTHELSLNDQVKVVQDNVKSLDRHGFVRVSTGADTDIHRAFRALGSRVADAPLKASNISTLGLAGVALLDYLHLCAQQDLDPRPYAAASPRIQQVLFDFLSDALSRASRRDMRSRVEGFLLDGGTILPHTDTTVEELTLCAGTLLEIVMVTRAEYAPHISAPRTLTSAPGHLFAMLYCFFHAVEGFDLNAIFRTELLNATETAIRRFKSNKVKWTWPEAAQASKDLRSFMLAMEQFVSRGHRAKIHMLKGAKFDVPASELPAFGPILSGYDD